MITNHTYNKARRVASQGGWGERAGGKKGGKKRKPRGTSANSMTFLREGTPKNNQHLPQPETTARVCRAQHHCRLHWSFLLINSKL